jgi:hypothetical protein
LCLASLFLLALIHKVQVLLAGTASAEPLIRNRGLHGARAAAALGVGAAIEVGIIFALVVQPAIGCTATSTLLLAYTWELRSLAEEESCGCFGQLLELQTRSAAIARNIALATLAMLSSVVYLTGTVEVASLSQLTVGLALLVASAAGAGALLHREARIARSHQ